MMGKTLFKPKGDDPFDAKPICFKVRKGIRDQVLEIPGIQDKLRAFVEAELEKHAQGE
jgi:hypothetical protein